MIELVCGLVCRGFGTPGGCRRHRVRVDEAQALDAVIADAAKQLNQRPVLEQVSAIPTIGRHMSDCSVDSLPNGQGLAA